MVMSRIAWHSQSDVMVVCKVPASFTCDGRVGTVAAFSRKESMIRFLGACCECFEEKIP